MVTAEEIYGYTSILLGNGRPDDDYRLLVPTAMNILLEEVRDTNNQLRLKMGKEKLEVFPLVTQLTDEIDIEDTVARVILPYGLSFLLLYEDNPAKATIYRNLYSYKLSVPTFSTYESVVDVYRGDCYGV